MHIGTTNPTYDGPDLLARPGKIVRRNTFMPVNVIPAAEGITRGSNGYGWIPLQSRRKVARGLGR